MPYAPGPTLPQTISPMTLLRGGVPLSLLMDLVLGPQSEDLLRWERGPGSAGTVDNS